MAGVGRIFQGVEYPSRREACQVRHREYVWVLADGLNFTQSAHAVGVSKRTGKVWRNGRTRSSGRCERASIAPQEHWYRLYMKCQPHRVSKLPPSWVLTCTFVTRTHPGNAVPTRIRTGPAPIHAQRNRSVTPDRSGPGRHRRPAQRPPPPAKR